MALPLLSDLINHSEYPVYRADVTLSTTQTFSYYMVFNSGLPQAADDKAVMACAQAIKTLDWSTVAGIPPGTTTTSVVITRATEQTSQRTV
jgi:hypothetical protein